MPERHLPQPYDSEGYSSCLTYRGSTKPFIDAVETGLFDAVRQGHTGLVLILSIRNLPFIVGTYGGMIADQLLSRFTENLVKAFPKSTTICRISHEDIGLVFPKFEELALQDLVFQLFEQVRLYGCNIADIPVQLTATLGSIDFPGSANALTTILDGIYIASHAAKEEPSNRHVSFKETKKRQTQAKHQMVLANYLQHAIAGEQLRLAFQPVINSQTGHIMYHECLLRIVDNDGKITSAGPFIPIAEKMGFIQTLDEIVLGKVIQELRANPEIMLAFNISNLTVNNPRWLRKAVSLMKDPAIGSRVIIEMTETAIHEDLRKVSDFVITLQQLGCQIAIDDFGAGYTSFRQLKALPVDIVKIDGYFIKDIVENADNLLFVKTLLEFTKGLGLKAVAEFVETGEIAKLLMELKVDYMQGNYFCPAVNYRSWLKEKRDEDETQFF